MNENYPQQEDELQTRGEHSRSLDDAERYRALQTLTELGLFVSVADLETFHGRVGTTDSDVPAWNVDPTFANGGNDSGNGNVNARPTLYASDRAEAQTFADVRFDMDVLRGMNAYFRNLVGSYSPEQQQQLIDAANKEALNARRYLTQEQQRKRPFKPYTAENLDFLLNKEVYRVRESMPEDEQLQLRKTLAADKTREVHEIVATDPDAVVINMGFDVGTLGAEQKKQYTRALQNMQIGINEGSPVAFDERAVAQPVIAAMRRMNKIAFSMSDVSDIATATKAKRAVVLQIAGAHNAQKTMLIRPEYVIDKLLGTSRAEIIKDTITVDQEQVEVPINLEYAERWLRVNHVVGVRQPVDSDTINRGITSVSFIDLERTKTATAERDRRRFVQKRLGAMASALGELVDTSPTPANEVEHMLRDAHVKPEKLVAAARTIDGYDALFDMDTGNWEHYTLGQHTETVLRNFDESFADKVPVEYLAPMRLALLVHDLGKPIAAQNGEVSNQKQYNLDQARDFLGKMGANEKLKKLTLALIGDGEDLAFAVDVRNGGKPALNALREYARQTLESVYDGSDVTDAMVGGFTQMCRMLQTCDGGAYTSMAVTTMAHGGGRYRNAGTFNDSFKAPDGLGKRTIRPRKGSDTGANSVAFSPTLAGEPVYNLSDEWDTV